MTITFTEEEIRNIIQQVVECMGFQVLEVDYYDTDNETMSVEVKPDFPSKEQISKFEVKK